jgi:cation-transporting ATPase E
VGSLTIGIPGFFLALAPNAPRARSGFVGRVVRFCIPAGLVAGGATFASFWLAREQVPLVEARSTATLVLLAVGLWILSVSARPLTHLRRMLLLVMGGAFALVLVVPGLRRFFDLRLPQWEVWIEGAAIAGLAAFVIESAWQWSRRRPGMLLGAD